MLPSRRVAAAIPDIIQRNSNLAIVYVEKAAKGARLTKLIDGRESAYFSQDLVTIRTDLPVADELAGMDDLPVDFPAAAEKFRERDLKTLAGEIDALAVGKQPSAELPEINLPDEKIES